MVFKQLKKNISHFFNTDYTFHLLRGLFTYRRHQYDYTIDAHYFKINMNNPDDLIQRYLNNTASDEERATLMAMIRSGQFEDDIKDMISEELRAEMLRSQTPDLAAQAKSEAIFEKIMQARTQEAEKMWIDRHEPITKNNKSWRYVWYTAASLLLIATVGVLVYTQRSQPQTETALAGQPDTSWVKILNDQTEVEKITLQDGSIISLEPGSEIQYPKQFGDKREICLSGEAFFEIAKDAAHPFLVYTSEVTTKVLGTSFRIKAHKKSKEIIVAVTTGKVSVFAKAADASAEEMQEVTLTPNLQAVYDRMQQSVVKKIVEHPSVIKPPSAKSYYTNVKVVDLLNVLSESYGVEIKYSETMLANCTLTTDIMDEEGLYDQLEVICNALGAHYAMEGATIVIESNGCEKSNVKP